ncbi:melanopsin [Plakobranchus ocellatus]|uniref:Melanopsin n=1 Tax=Plakobranchus ocellatus TaxID=259542 RepID=A0AAV4BWP4_9GAST|nr:melanopsin [Plakobranchus ocellatus]
MELPPLIGVITKSLKMELPSSDWRDHKEPHASLRTSSNLFIMNLTVADFLMGVTDLPVFAISSLKGCWFLEFTGCQIYGMTTGVFGLVTIHTLAAIALDRYIVVVRTLNPRNRMPKSTSVIIIVIIWMFSLVWSAVPLTGISMYRLEGLGTSCTFNYVKRNTAEIYYFLGLISFNLLMPFLIINFSYLGIYVNVRRIKRELSLLMDSHGYATRKRVQVQAEVRTAITSAVIVTIFILSWMPYAVISFYGLFGPSSAPVKPLVSMMPNFLAKLSIVANPILYSIGHPNVRKKIVGFLPKFSYQSSFRQVSGVTVQESFNHHSVSLHEFTGRISS